MHTHPRTPLHDLPVDHFLPPPATGSKAPRKHKRPLSPSRTTPLNPAKRRVLDAEGISFSITHAITPTKPSRLGNGLARHHASSQATSSPLSHRHPPSRELYPKLTAESSMDPQSRHYPGFDIFRDGERRRSSPAPKGFLPPDDDEDKENVPLRRKAKKFCPKKRLLTGLDGSGVPVNRTVRSERTPFSARQAMR